MSTATLSKAYWHSNVGTIGPDDEPESANPQLQFHCHDSKSQYHTIPGGNKFESFYGNDPTTERVTQLEIRCFLGVALSFDCVLGGIQLTSVCFRLLTGDRLDLSNRKSSLSRSWFSVSVDIKRLTESTNHLRPTCRSASVL
jgi:hypothetical protein